DNLAAPIRCTQNPTQGEEWKRNWHPEKIEPSVSDDPVLVVGAGPAGLEAAMQLANRGYQVTLAEANESLGGRVTLESQLPGLASYARVRDYREMQILKHLNVEVYRSNELSAKDILALEIPHVLIATGSHWRRDGAGRQHSFPVQGIDTVSVMTPDDILAGVKAKGRVLIYDDDHYYMGGAIAEQCRNEGLEVTLVTPDSKVSSWTENTLEQDKIQSRLLALDINILPLHELHHVHQGEVVLANIYDQTIQQTIAFDSLILITSRSPSDALYQSLLKHEATFKTLKAVGDCHAPGTVAAAVFEGHLAARSLESTVDEYEALFRREVIALS
ncbi:MAG: dimethylamine/trimethylamine dehydrogenase, partial [Gammaproteobacteria bacterium]